MENKMNKTHRHLARAWLEIEMALNSMEDKNGSDLRRLILRAMYATESAETAADRGGNHEDL